MLFAEASVEQIKVILDCRGVLRFGEFSKSRVFFSKLVDGKDVEVIVAECGLTPSSNLGLYHGAPSIHNRMNSSIYQHLLDKMDAKLKSWSVRSRFHV